MVDLDLGVIAWTDGRVVIGDEPEFVEHRLARNYPAAAVAQQNRRAPRSTRSPAAARNRCLPIGTDLYEPSRSGASGGRLLVCAIPEAGVTT